jgi:hypothetical protein
MRYFRSYAIVVSRPRTFQLCGLIFGFVKLLPMTGIPSINDKFPIALIDTLRAGVLSVIAVLNRHIAGAYLGHGQYCEMADAGCD